MHSIHALIFLFKQVYRRKMDRLKSCTFHVHRGSNILGKRFNKNKLSDENKNLIEYLSMYSKYIYNVTIFSLDQLE